MRANEERKFMARIAAVFLVAAALLSGGCGEPAQTPTKGQVTVVVSEEILPLIREEETVFEDLYRDARVDLRPATAREAIADLFNDSVSVIISARPLNGEEKEAARIQEIELSEFRFARDAVAVIVNNSNSVTKLTLSGLDSVFSGLTKDWGILGWRGAAGRISVYLPDRNLASYEVFAGAVLGGKKYTTPDSILLSSPDMIGAVEKNPLAIGIVGMNWMRENKGRVRILELTNPAAPDSLGIAGKFIFPHQAYVYNGFYPVVRDIFIYSTPDSYGVSSGFISFLTSAAGQRIVVNQGLVPATMPVRLVELKKENM